MNLLILPARDLSSWLSALSSDLPLSALTLPGSHESCARYGWPISQCQSVISTISKQLLDGLRFLDIRLSVKGEPGKERLLCYHGISDERLAFDVVLKETHEFLDAHPSGKLAYMLCNILFSEELNSHLWNLDRDGPDVHQTGERADRLQGSSPQYVRRASA